MSLSGRYSLLVCATILMDTHSLVWSFPFSCRSAYSTVFSSNFQTLPRASIYVLFPIVQEKLLVELNLEMETTSNRLDFVQVCFVSSAPSQCISS